MIFDRIEWDELNLDHATKRLTAEEIEQAIWNADRMFPHREDPDRTLFRSVTDGGKAVVVLAARGDSFLADGGRRARQAPAAVSASGIMRPRKMPFNCR